MHFSQDEILQLTTSIWEQMLHLPINPHNEPVLEGDESMCACVQIVGSWLGVVYLSCNHDFASRAAGIMFGLDTADTKKADMQDALGELANMIGGNIKALLPEPCQLSLPAVVDGAEQIFRIPRSKVLNRIPLRCEGYLLNITLLEKEAPNN